MCGKIRRVLASLPHDGAETTVDGGSGGQSPDTPPETVNADIPPYIVKREKGIRAAIGHWIMIRAAEPGLTNKAIADRIGISPRTLSTYIYQATKAGWLRFDDPLAQLEFEIVPKVVENLKHYLDARDKQVTIETAKGALFPAYKESKGIQEAQQTVLAMRIELPESTEGLKAIPGHIVGTPKGS